MTETQQQQTETAQPQVNYLDHSIRSLLACVKAAAEHNRRLPPSLRIGLRDLRDELTTLYLQEVRHTELEEGALLEESLFKVRGELAEQLPLWMLPKPKQETIGGVLPPSTTPPLQDPVPPWAGVAPLPAEREESPSLPEVPEVPVTPDVAKALMDLLQEKYPAQGED